jgi:ABC-type bacteriocin/lantibiotic exporter with double-glycine peptidase domain
MALVLIFFLLKNTFAVFLQRRIHSLCEGLVEKFTENAFYQTIQQPVEQIVNSGTKDFLNKIHFNSMHFTTGILLPFVNIIGESLVIVMMLLLVVWINPGIFFLIILVTAPAFYFINSTVKQKIYQLGERENTIESLNIGINGLVDVKVNHSSAFFINDFLKKQRQLVSSDLKSIYYQNIPSRANELVVLIGVIVLVAYGYFISDNPAGMRALSALFVVSVFRLVPALNRLLIAAMKLKLHQYTIDYLHHNQVQNHIVHHEKIEFKDKIQLNNLVYHYEHQLELINGVNATIEKGEIYGIIGKSGSGKSTLMKLISGLISPHQGELLVDGKLITPQNLQSWQNQIGYVHQAPFIFNKSIHENIALNFTYDAEKMNRAIQLAGLSEFVLQQSQGLQTLLGEQGSKISEGQKQRIAIARALYRESSVLLFDEATSGLDAETEETIIESIKTLQTEKVTVILIAHKKRLIDLCTHTIELKS